MTRTVADLVHDKALSLVGFAASVGLNVTITREPCHPLAMGNVRNVIEVWPLRHRAEPTVQHLPSCDTEGGEM